MVIAYALGGPAILTSGVIAFLWEQAYNIMIIIVSIS